MHNLLFIMQGIPSTKQFLIVAFHMSKLQVVLQGLAKIPIITILQNNSVRLLFVINLYPYLCFIYFFKHFVYIIPFQICYDGDKLGDSKCLYVFIQRGLNRWSNNSEQKLGFLSKVKILKNAFNKK